MSFNLHKLKRRVQAVGSTLADWAFFIGIVLIGGLGSSWYMVEAGSRLTTAQLGPWIHWTAAARADADPYTRAHFSRAGTLPLPTEVASTYLARTDNDGTKLHSSCDYLVEGSDLDAGWWSLTVFDDAGRLIPNPAKRHAFTSETITRSGDGRFAISLARDARPGNWLPTGRAGRLSLLLVRLEPTERRRAAAAENELQRMPLITKVSCR